MILIIVDVTSSTYVEMDDLCIDCHNHRAPSDRIRASVRQNQHDGQIPAVVLRHFVSARKHMLNG